MARPKSPKKARLTNPRPDRSAAREQVLLRLRQEAAVPVLRVRAAARLVPQVKGRLAVRREADRVEDLAVAAHPEARGVPAATAQAVRARAHQAREAQRAPAVNRAAAEPRAEEAKANRALKVVPGALEDQGNLAITAAVHPRATLAPLARAAKALPAPAAPPERATRGAPAARLRPGPRMGRSIARPRMAAGRGGPAAPAPTDSPLQTPSSTAATRRRSLHPTARAIASAPMALPFARTLAANKAPRAANSKTRRVSLDPDHPKIGPGPAARETPPPTTTISRRITRKPRIRLKMSISCSVRERPVQSGRADRDRPILARKARSNRADATPIRIKRRIRRSAPPPSAWNARSNASRRIETVA
jgi:hypothetical protein